MGHTTPQHHTENMSWQSYVDDQLISTKVIKNAVIAGHDGNIWAASAGFPVSVEELKSLLGRYANTDELAMNGVTIGGLSTCSSQQLTGLSGPRGEPPGSTASKLYKPLSYVCTRTLWCQNRPLQSRKSWENTSSLWATEGF